MPLSQRSHSINTYCLSKVFFRCAQDIAKITASIKSWLFLDQLEKPEDFLLYRNKPASGLGLMNVKIQALALFIRSFLETAIMDKFQRNFYHEGIYRWHFLSDRIIFNPEMSPYFKVDIFEHMRDVLTEGLLNFKTMTTNIWYRVLLEKLVTPSAIKGQIKFRNWLFSWG